MTVRSLVVRLLALPTRDRLAAAHDPSPTTVRELTIVEVIDDEDRSGFGECSALTSAGYTPEWARGAFMEISATNGRPTSPMAVAGTEMATTDLALRRRRCSLASELHDRSRHGANPPETIPAGVVLPLGSLEATVQAASSWVARGVSRLKLKVEPGWLTEPVAAVRAAAPDVELHVDANGSCGADQLDALLGLDDFAITVIEQPFAIDDVTSAIRLARDSHASVVADEAATDLASIIELVEAGACNGVVVKPGRLGGLEPTIAVHDWCLELGVPLVAGGMLESGLGRHALAAVSSLPGFTICGDLSPARRWLADDPFADLSMIDGWILVPTDPGVAPPPDRSVLDRYTIDSVTIRGPNQR